MQEEYGTLTSLTTWYVIPRLYTSSRYKTLVMLGYHLSSIKHNRPITEAGSKTCEEMG